MPPKKQANNGFYYYMIEYKKKPGRKFANMKEVADAAGPHWSRMSKAERKPYEDKASYFRNNSKPMGRVTSDGIEVDRVLQEEEAKQQKIQRMKEEINQTIKVAANNNRIEYETFFVIHVNFFVNAHNRLYPAEIAVAGFNLFQGVMEDDIFHRMMHPGPLPLGYASDARLHSRDTHNIPPPDGGDGDQENLQEVLNELIQFLSEKMPGSTTLPPLYVEEKSFENISRFMEHWPEDCGEDSGLFKVFNLEYMFRVLKNTAAGKVVWPSDTFSVREIEKDVYAYSADITCEFHHLTGQLFCSKSIVTRYVYVICDNCSPDLEIDLKPGFHIPLPLQEKEMSSRYSKSTRSNLTSRSRTSTIRDTDTESVVSFDNSDWDTESVTSGVSAVTNSRSNDFPALGSYSQRSTQPMSDDNMSQKSYATAMSTSSYSRRAGASSPWGAKNDAEESLLRVMNGRGRGAGFQQTDGDFPLLGQGRGRGFKR